MLKHFHLCGVLIAGLIMLAAVVAQADNRAGVRLLDKATDTPATAVSLSMNGDCSQTVPAAAPECKTYKPCVSYCGCCGCCGPKVSQVLKVKTCCDCCCCCVAEIPVCLPACCKDPCVSCRCGLFGRTIVTYSYDCCCVTIVFRRCGDVVVRYS